MDLTAWLLRHTPVRPLVVTVPGGTEARLVVERISRERGWPPALSPAEANLLVVAGPDSAAIQSSVDQVWSTMPAPRARADVRTAGDAQAVLDEATVALRDAHHQRGQTTPTEGAPPPAEHHNSGHDEHSGHDMHGHHGHDMGEMEMPGGVPMADRAEDRDGLKLDQLTVPLGPALPDWPVGLVVHTRMQGDIVQRADVELLGVGGAAGESWWDRPCRRSESGERVAIGAAARLLAARRLDSCATMLAITGWPDASVTARRLRDDTLSGRSPDQVRAPLLAWATRVRRSRTLRWLLAGVGQTPDEPSTPNRLAGDALTRLHRWVDSAVRASEHLDDGGALSADPQDWLQFDHASDTRWTIDALPHLLMGSEFAVARLIVASLDPDVDVLSGHEAHHG